MKKYERERKGFTPIVLQIFEDLEAYKDWCRFEGKPFNEADLYKPQTTWGKYEAFLRRRDRSYRRRSNNNEQQPTNEA
jgi:hypothetical protein